MQTARVADFNPVRAPQAMTEPCSAASAAAAAGSIAVVHDWFPNFRGGERVVARICRQIEDANVFTLFDFLPDDVKAEHFGSVRFHASPANRLPFIRQYYRSLFFLCPILIEQFDVTGYDAVISSSAAFARGVITRPDQPHLCYVHSPVRYAWDEQFSYIQQARLGFGPKGLLYRHMLHRLRLWDTRTAHGPDLLVANSSFVRSRIRQIYGRDAIVVHPPVGLDESEASADRDDYYVAACFNAPYKRTDLVIRAFNAMPSRRLIVVGGEQTRALRALAGPNVRLVGHLERRRYVETVARARAMVFAGCEDFGIALAEAQGWGTPLVALGRGGALDIVRPLGGAEDPTGVLFRTQSVEAVVEAVERFERNRQTITPEACRASAQRFSEARFDREILEALARALELNAAR